MIPLRYPNSNMNTKYPYLIEKCNKYPNLDFAFPFARPVAVRSEMEKIIHISHEFQHAVQFKTNKKTYFYGCIIREYLGDKVISEQKVPTEYDAKRKSKIVTYSLCEKKEVDEFIQRMLADPSVPKTFWGIYNSIDIEEDYDFENEVLELWKIHNIEEKVDEFKKKSIRNVDQEKIIEMYYSHWI